MGKSSTEEFPWTGERAMKVVTNTTPAMIHLAKKSIPSPSMQAKARLKWFSYYESHDHNVSLTCRHFGISRQTFYRWKRRYNPRDLSTLEDRPSIPKKRRVRTWSAEQVEAVRKVREEYPRWGKEKLQVILEGQKVYNTVRPHQALGYLTPKQFLDNWYQQHPREEDVSRR
ncbi:MAG: helix-turn-helix domain-containing protein [Sphingomonadaceae bacterium]